MDDINYDDDDFDQDTDNLGDEALDKLGALVSGRWEDDQDTSDYIRSIREELDQGSDDSLAGGIDLDMDAEISNLLGESMEHIQMKAKTREGSASLRDDFLDEISPLFGEERKDEFRLSSRTLDKFDIPLGLESPDLDRTLSPAKSLGLAGLGVLTEDSGGLALMNEAHQKSLPSLDKDTRQSRLLDRTSPDISGLLGGDDMDSSRLSQETKRSSRSHRRNSKDQSGVSSGDGLSKPLTDSENSSSLQPPAGSGVEEQQQSKQAVVERRRKFSEGKQVCFDECFNKKDDSRSKKRQVAIGTESEENLGKVGQSKNTHGCQGVVDCPTMLSKDSLVEQKAPSKDSSYDYSSSLHRSLSLPPWTDLSSDDMMSLSQLEPTTPLQILTNIGLTADRSRLQLVPDRFFNDSVQGRFPKTVLKLPKKSVRNMKLWLETRFYHNSMMESFDSDDSVFQPLPVSSSGAPKKSVSFDFGELNQSLSTGNDKIPIDITSSCEQLNDSKDNVFVCERNNSRHDSGIASSLSKEHPDSKRTDTNEGNQFEIKTGSPAKDISIADEIMVCSLLPTNEKVSRDHGKSAGSIALIQNSGDEKGPTTDFVCDAAEKKTTLVTENTIAIVDGIHHSSVSAGGLLAKLSSVHKLSSDTDEQVTFPYMNATDSQLLPFVSDNPGLMNGHDHLLSGSSALWESSNHKRRMSDVERERLASESAKAQAEIENALNSRLSEKTPSPLAKTHSSGKYSSSPADIAEMTAAVERRWAFKPILGDLELGKIKRSPAGSLGDSIDSQREESGHQLKRMLQDIQEVTGDLADLQHRKEILQRELLLLQETLGRNKSELKRCEKKAGEHRSASKELQAEVGSMQRKREYLQGELRKLDSALAERRSVREGSPLSPTQSKNSEDYMKLLNDNTQLKSDLETVRSKLKADGLAKEKEISQLKRQLKAASEDLFAEKKKARDQYDKLKEDYEEAQRQLRDTLRDKMSAVSRARDDAETSKHVDLEVMKVKILREKDSELEKIKEKLGRQVEDMKKSLLAKDKELLKANLKWKERNEAGSALSAQLSECKKQLAEKDSLLSKSDRKTRTQLDDVNRTLTARESEIKQLKSLLKQQEESERSLGERLRAEAHKQMRKAVEHERSQQGKTREQELKRERELMKDEMERSVAAAKDELAKEHQKSKQMQETMNSLRQEVEEQQQLAKQANREKLAAVNKVKEIARLSRRQDFEKLKEKLQQNHHSSIKKLRSKVLKLDEDIKQAKENEKVLQQRERDLVAKIELSEKAIVMEINEECRKTSAAVSSFSVGYGRRSRPGTPKLFGSMERLPTGGPERERPMSAPPMPVRKDSNSSKAALSQLRSSNDELRSHLSQLKSELDRERQTATQLHRDKVAELKKVRDSVQTERADEIQGLKQKLLKELASEKASFQKQALKEVTLKFHKQLKAKDDELRELGQEIQKLRDEGSQKMTHLVHSGMNQEADRRAKEHIRKLEIQQRAERAAFQREKEKLERELKRLGQEAATHAAAAAAASSTASSTASTTVVDKTTASASAEAAKAKAAVGLVHRLQTKMKQLYGENERLKREVAELQKVSVAARQTPDTPQPRDNSIEAQDSGLSSMAADAGFADAHHLQQELKASVRKNQRMSALLNEKMKEVVKLQNQLKHLNKEFLVLQREHSVTVDRLGDDIDNNVS